MKYSCLPDHSSQGVITRVSTYLAVQIRRATSYYSAIHLSKPTDKEILSALRRPEMIEKIKKFVFISLFKAHGLNFGNTAAEDETVKRMCLNIEDSKEWMDCYFNALKKSGNVERQNLRLELFRDAQKALSDDRVNLKGNEFLIFVM